MATTQSQQSQQNDESIPFEIDDQYFCDLKISGKGFPGVGSAIREMSICNSIRALTPTLKVVMKDPTSRISNDIAAGDGFKIETNFGSKKGETSTFRSVAPPAGKSTAQFGGQILGIIDAPKLLSLAKGGYSGNSSEVIKKIAEEVGLEATVDASNDKMNWLPGRVTYGKFLHQVANHGWFDDAGCSIIAITEDKKLLYTNIVSRITGKEVKEFWSVKPPEDAKNAQEFVDWAMASKSGIMNSALNYGARIGQMMQSGTYDETKEVTATRMSDSLEINKEIKDIVSSVRSMYAPPDCGNVHANYMKARYQNIRLRALFNFDIELLFEKETGSKLLDLVKLNILDYQGQPNTNLNGLYFISAKTRIIRGHRYFEKLRLTSTGRSLDPQEQMV